MARSGAFRRRALIVVLAVGVVVVLALVAAYVERRQIAREAVGQWLSARGVPSDTHFAALGPGRLIGRVRIGPAAAPDLTVERAEVRYSLMGLIAGAGVRVTEVRLTHPVLKARLRGGRFSAGALDPLIDELLRQPPKPGEPHPRIVVDDGRVELDTDYGALVARASARVRDNKLISLDAVTAPARFTLADARADIGAATLQARTAGGRIAASLRAPIARLATSAGTVRDGELVLGLQGAYPDLENKTAPIRAQAWATLAAAGADAKGATVGPMRIVARAPQLSWFREPGRLTGDAELSLAADGLEAGELKLATVSATASGPFSLGAGTQARLDMRAQGQGGWTGLGPPVASDLAEVSTLKRALSAFGVSAEGLSLNMTADRLEARLTAPVRVRPRTGGEVRLFPQGLGYRLTSSGGGLPQAQVDILRVGLKRDGLDAEGSARASLSAGPVRDARLDAAGTLRVGGGGASFTASRCAHVAAGRLALRDTAIERIAARVCPAGEPVFRSAPGGWRLAARIEDAAADLSAQQVVVQKAAGLARASGSGSRLAADVTLASAQVRDAGPSVRFRPFTASGAARLDHDQLTGGFDARLGERPALGHAALRHDLKSGEGEVRLSTDRIAFAPGDLQPADLSPLAEPLGTGVAGAVTFSGAVRWTPAGTASEGRLDLMGLDFKSPAGQVNGLSGSIRLASLAPLTAPAGQTLTAREIDAALPLTQVSISLELKEKTLVVTGGAANVGGGRVSVERLEVPLEAGLPLTGAIAVEGVQLHDLVEASPFGDRVDFDARVSGRIPFSVQDDKISIAGGDLHAIAPGRLSISRTALTSIAAEGTAPASVAAAVGPQTTDTITDFAYQAMENLAFNELDAGLASKPDGRLGVLFHIKGRHDPPQRQEIRISWTDLIRRRFLGSKLPLPSDTAVDLTLDTTLNVNDLLRDYANYQRLRSSPPVQR